MRAFRIYRLSIDGAVGVCVRGLGIADVVCAGSMCVTAAAAGAGEGVGRRVG